MDLVLRPANDRFLLEVAFPAFTVGMTDARGAFAALSERIGDPQARTLAELLGDQASDGGFDGLAESSAWMELCYRLLFSEWRDVGAGWRVVADAPGFAADLDASLHLALMVEHPDYPYENAPEAAAFRASFARAPEIDLTLASLICGLWESESAFYPEWVLSTVGRARPSGGGAGTCADWAYRDWSAVRDLAERLPKLFDRLLRREAARLPVEIPEVPEISAYWAGKLAEPPLLTVAFSGLGRQSAGWVRELGDLSAVVRAAARGRMGLTALATGRRTDRGD